MDELLEALGYKVKSTDMADVAQKIQQLEMVMGEDGLLQLSDTVHYNPSDQNQGEGSQSDSSSDVLKFIKYFLNSPRHIPSKFIASGEEIGNELDINEVDCDDEVSNFKIFEEKTLSPFQKALLDVISMEKGETRNINAICKGKKPMVKYKTSKIKHFDKTMKEAADILQSFYKYIEAQIERTWNHRMAKKKPVKRNKDNNVSIIQIVSDKEDNGATQKPSTKTIKIEHAGCMIKSRFLITQATFENVEKEIDMKFKLSSGTYRLEYLDEDGDWIWLKSDEEMCDSIESSRKPDQIVVRLRVLLE